VRKVPIPSDRLRWLELRQQLQQDGNVSASDAGALCGVSPFTTLGDLAVRYLHPEPIVDTPNEAMRRGSTLEPALLAWLSDEIGLEITEPTHMYVANRVASTPDGEIVGCDDTQPEAKTIAAYLDGQLPDHWRCQAVAQCLARPSLRRVLFVVLDSSLRITVHEVVPTTSELDDMAERVRRFLAFVSLGCVPDGADLSEQNVRTLWPEPEPAKAIEADETAAELATEWAMTRQARLDLEKREKAMKDRLADVIRDAEVLTIDGRPVVTFKVNGKGRSLAPAGELR
jgi:predicted phage-related endonuclease